MCILHILSNLGATMKAAIVRNNNQSPVYADFPDPILGKDECLVQVSASSLNQISKGRASGKHYSTANEFPFVAGVDGVGRREDGSRVYFVLPKSPQGSMAEQCAVLKSHCIALPHDIDDVTAAAIANPGMSSWAALKERARIVKGETVLINGATGTSGKLAVQIAKYLGACKVIATGRNRETLASLTALGADVCIELSENKIDMGNAFKQQFSEGVDIVLDYLWGDSAETLLIAAAKATPDLKSVRYVQIGSVSGSDITLPSAVLRASAIQLMGSGIGSVSLEKFIQVIAELLQATASEKFHINTITAPLSDVEILWNQPENSERLVFIMEHSNA